MLSSELAHSAQERLAVRETRDAFSIVDGEVDGTTRLFGAARRFLRRMIKARLGYSSSVVERRVGYDAALHLHCNDKVMKAFASPHHSHNFSTSLLAQNRFRVR